MSVLRASGVDECFHRAKGKAEDGGEKKALSPLHPRFSSPFSSPHDQFGAVFLLAVGTGSLFLLLQVLQVVSGCHSQSDVAMFLMFSILPCCTSSVRSLSTVPGRCCSAWPEAPVRARKQNKKNPECLCLPRLNYPALLIKTAHRSSALSARFPARARCQIP